MVATSGIAAPPRRRLREKISASSRGRGVAANSSLGGNVAAARSSPQIVQDPPSAYPRGSRPRRDYSSPSARTGTKTGAGLDARIERAVDWLAARVDDNASILSARVENEIDRAEAWDAEQKKKKEARVFRKTLRKAAPLDGASSPEECFDANEGVDYFRSELGLSAEDALHETAARLAKLVNYQKLALSMMACWSSPVNPKKSAPQSWPEIAAYVDAKWAEKWEPAVVAKDEADDPTSMANRAKARAAAAAAAA